MGFDDEDFRKAEKQCSNTQLYKQAGNSIVVDCLEGILQNLFSEEKPANAQKSNEELLEWLDELLGE
jgi:DNA (cytosine-5)-methyltransferase 1